MIKLYQAHSTVDNYAGRDRVTFSWFVNKRERPAAPYEELIAGYQELSDDPPKGYAEAFIDELLTEAEVEELRDYLAKRHKTELQIEEVALPLQEAVAGYGALGVGGGTDYYMLSEEDGYSLSVPIYGFYDLRLCPSSTSFSPEMAEAGQELLARALDGLVSFVKAGGQWPAMHSEPLGLPGLQELLRDIYDETGLYVQRGLAKAERLEKKERELRRIEKTLKGDNSISEDELSEDGLPF